ncbi:PRTRC system ParB family protein [Zoogloea sp.]|uniref:PRTRC system ParB family protein n=1 Tax=Zoogloea sp. TaxID=49181 RepID=UPI0025CECDF8|nr:PRTRC system ParB family protein [Zoogloea sp.]MCK6394995.1 PRTRC system ParB family protein [Zoogloea sp.]
MDTPNHPTLPLRRIVQGKNPREYFDPAEMAELEDGLRAAGRVIQPILVRPIPGTDRYEIVAGERRWRAAQTVFGDDYDMPVVIEALSDEQAEAFATIENHHRAAMSRAEEAQAARRQLMRHKGDKDEAAAALGWKPELLERRLALLTCTPAVLKALTHRQIQLGHAELLAGVPPEKQNAVLTGVIAHKVPVGVLKEQLGRFARRLADAIFDIAQCAACQHNSSRQSGLFDASLGDGFCQHPTHYDELTQQAVAAKAASLGEQYPMVRIVKATDGFLPLSVAEDGALGVGAAQYAACKGCASFGCAVSAMPGTQGEVTTSLCFDAACNSQKVAAWVKAQRESTKQERTSDKAVAQGSKRQPASKTNAKPATAPSNKTPQRVVDYRLMQWRKWAAKELMVQPERNRRVMVALARSGRASDVRSTEYGQAASRIAGAGAMEGTGFRGLLQEVDAIDAQHLERLTLAVTAAAAFGVTTHDLEALLNYLQVDEAKHFKWDAAFLELFTLSELDALASEVGLRAKIGASLYKLAREKKKADFIKALLAVSDFPYDGSVPAVMRYPRKTEQPEVEPLDPDAAEEVEGADEDAALAA